MQKSSAYEDFLEQSKATGRQKLDGYNPDLLDQIYPEERSEVEDIVVGLFLHGDPDVAMFLPQLRKYDGIELLKKKLNDSIVPSWVSIQCALALFKQTGEEEFLNLLMENYNKKQYQLEVLSSLLECVPSDRICQIFQDCCIHDEDSVNRTTAATGILYCKGIIKDPMNNDEFMNNMELIRKMTKQDMEMRRQAVEEIMKE